MAPSTGSRRELRCPICPPGRGHLLGWGALDAIGRPFFVKARRLPQDELGRPEQVAEPFKPDRPGPYTVEYTRRCPDCGDIFDVTPHQRITGTGFAQCQRCRRAKVPPKVPGSEMRTWYLRLPGVGSFYSRGRIAPVPVGLPCLIECESGHSVEITAAKILARFGIERAAI